MARLKDLLSAAATTEAPAAPSESSGDRQLEQQLRETTQALQETASKLQLAEQVQLNCTLLQSFQCVQSIFSPT